MTKFFFFFHLPVLLSVYFPFSHLYLQVFTTDTRICAYSISNIDDKNSGLPVTCLRWKPDTHNQSYGNVLLATCMYSKQKFAITILFSAQEAFFLENSTSLCDLYRSAIE